MFSEDRAIKFLRAHNLKSAYSTLRMGNMYAGMFTWYEKHMSLRDHPRIVIINAQVCIFDKAWPSDSYQQTITTAILVETYLMYRDPTTFTQYDLLTVFGKESSTIKIAL